MIATLDWFQPAALSSEPPSASAAVASAVAVCLPVPLVSKVAVSVASPESLSGSASLPDSTSSCAVTSRTPRRSASKMRSPFGSFCSTGGATASGRGAAGAGGVG